MHTESSLCAKLQSWSEDIEAYKNKNKNKKPAILKLHVSVNKHIRFKKIKSLRKMLYKTTMWTCKMRLLIQFSTFLFWINIQLSTWKLNAHIIIIIIIVRDILAH